MTLRSIRLAGLPSALWLGMSLVFAWLTLRDFHSFELGTYDDDAAYAILAQSIVGGGSYGLVNGPGLAAPTRFPPGFPIVLAAATAWHPERLDLLPWISLLASLATGGLIYRGWRWLAPGLSTWWAVAVVGAYLTSPLTVGHGRMVMSEPLFTAICLAALVLVGALGAPGRPLVGSAWLGYGLGLGALTFGAVMTRTIGVALLGAVFIAAVRARSTGTVHVLAAMTVSWLLLSGLLVVLTPVAWRDVVPIEYAGQLFTPSRWGQSDGRESLAPRFVDGAREYVSDHLRQIVVPIGGGTAEQALASRWGLPWAPLALNFVIAGLIGLGLVIWWRRAVNIAPLLFLFIYLPILLVWAWRGPRFLYPVHFVLLLAFLLGCNAVLSELIRRLNLPSGVIQVAMAALVAGLVTVSVAKSLRIESTVAHVGRLQERTAWIRQNTPPETIIATGQPEVDYLYSRRKTVAIPPLSSLGALREFVSTNRIAFILAAPEIRWQDRWRPSFGSNTRRLLQLAGEQHGRSSSAPEVVEVFTDNDSGIRIFRVAEVAGSFASHTCCSH